MNAALHRLVALLTLLIAATSAQARELALDLMPDKGAKLADIAVVIMKQAHGATLDYSPASLKLIDDYVREIRANGATPQSVNKSMVILGGYVGEVLVRNLSARWDNPDEREQEHGYDMSGVRSREGVLCDPIGQVFMLLKYGEADSLERFYGAVARGLSRTPEFVSEQEFSWRIASAAGSLSDLVVDIEGPLQLRLRHADGSQGRSNLSNAYKEYRGAPELLASIIARRAVHVAQLPNSEQVRSNMLSQLLPVIRGADTVAAFSRQLSELQARSKTADLDGMVSAPLADGLTLFYVYDRPDSVVYLTAAEARRIGLSPAELRQLGLENLRQQLAPKLQMKNEGALHTLVLDKNYESSFLLLAEELKQWIGPAIHGDLVAFVLARGTVLLTGTNDAEALQRAQRQADKASTLPNYISSKPFVYRKGSWQAFTF